MEGQENRRRVVVNHQRRLGTGQVAEELLHVAVALSAAARFQVDFQITVAPGDRGHRLTGGFA